MSLSTGNVAKIFFSYYNHSADVLSADDVTASGVRGGLGKFKELGRILKYLILILFLFISFMEDTGYMARAAFIFKSCILTP